MPKFDVTLHTEVVALICESDRFTPEGWRVWLQPTLDAPTLNAIIWQGSPHDFAANLVITLTHEQLVAALADLHSEDRGIGWRARVGALCHRINEHALTPRVAGQPNSLLVAYHQRCQAQWQKEPGVLDDRFVELVMLPREEADLARGGLGGSARRIECDDLRALLAHTNEPTVLLLGAPGGGKSTLLRRLQWDMAADCLNNPDDHRLVFFVPLNRYRLEDNHPRDWLNARWREFAPELRELDELLQTGRMLLLLDGLNEMRCSGPADFGNKVEQWQEFLSSIALRGNRAVFTCRERDYVGALDTNSAPLAIADVQSLSPELIQKFLQRYIPMQAKRVFEQIDGDDKLRALYATPYFLSLLIPQVGSQGDIPPTRARLFTGFVRQALREELRRGTRLIATNTVLLHERDKPDLHGTPATYWLPTRGLLIQKLSGLAFEMQQRYKAGGAQVAIEVDEARPILGDHADDLVEAGRHIKMLDEVSGSGQIKFFHQLLQEYFAARELARQPERAPALVATAWRTSDLEMPYATWLTGEGRNPRERTQAAHQRLGGDGSHGRRDDGRPGSLCAGADAGEPAAGR